jgi:hypothetical protein
MVDGEAAAVVERCGADQHGAGSHQVSVWRHRTSDYTLDDNHGSFVG